MKPFIQTYTEQILYYDSPEKYEFTIEEIAYALSSTCRYNRQVPFYCVAQHSILLSLNIPEDLALTALVHDSAEAYLPDVPKSLKPTIRGFRELEDSILRVIARQFEIPFRLFDDRRLKELDTRILLDEKKVLFDIQDYNWGLQNYEPIGISSDIILDKPMSYWRKRFERRFEELTK